MSSKTIIRISNLSVEFQRWGQSVPALVGINLEIMESDWIMLVGHNGSGKSTLLKTLTNEVVPKIGTVERFDRSIADDVENKYFSELFYVSQDPLAGTAEELTLLENMVVADPRSCGLAQRFKNWKQEYVSMLDEYELAPRMNQLLKYFSGGERQQIAMLIAKLRNPRVLLLDEPFAALDLDRVPICLQLITSMNDAGCTVLQTSHDMQFAHTNGHRTIALQKGRILYDRVGKMRSSS